ncbi:inorganic phosphate transporter family protein [Halobacillus sp. A1]|uniref:inorganic phosphate transporter n=1 Tax=Halobacillus sp. A1 TaxID=2880262 RepID=UPI0020A6527C|nr:inorganic phosphate transporter [Halobacillus sp. A1]MCP3030015.1 inorganic phosphate transporter family protein [Halobacillus sp. A1]
MTLIIVCLFVAHFFAFNVGASGSAATMGIAYGTGVVKKKRIALLLSGAGCMLGAFWGGEVVETIGKGLISSDLLTIQAAAIILFVSAATLCFTNIIGIPLSTSEVTVGAIVGVSISLQQLYLRNLLEILSFWIIIPVAAFITTFILGILLKHYKSKYRFLPSKRTTKILSILLVLTGFLEAFAAGMNNVANAIGPLVGADVLSMNAGLLTGGLFMALGSVFLGGRVLETNGKKISYLSLSDGVVISGTSGLLVLGASIIGIPIPMTQVTTSAIVGTGAVKDWKGIWENKVIHQIVKVWVASPMISLVIAFCLTEVLLQSNFYTVAIIASGIVATLILTNFGRGAIVNKSKHHTLKEEF